MTNEKIYFVAIAGKNLLRQEAVRALRDVFRDVIPRVHFEPVATLRQLMDVARLLKPGTIPIVLAEPYIADPSPEELITNEVLNELRRLQPGVQLLLVCQRALPRNCAVGPRVTLEDKPGLKVAIWQAMRRQQI